MGSGETFNFTPQDNGAYAVTLTVTDKDGGVGSIQRVVQVANVAPQGVSAGQNMTVNEGAPVSLSATLADPGANDTHSFLWKVSAENGQVVPNGTSSSFNFVPADSGTYLVSLTVTDDDGGATSQTLYVDVLNVAPTVELGSNITVGEGTAFALAGTVFDPAGINDALTYAWSVSNSQGQVVATGAGTPFQFTPTDNGVYGVSLTVTDPETGQPIGAVTLGISLDALSN